MLMRTIRPTRTYGSKLNKYKLTKDATTDTDVQTEEIELTEEQMAQLQQIINGGGMSEVPQMLADPSILAYYQRLENREIIIEDFDDDVVYIYQQLMDYVAQDNEANIPISERTPVKIFINSNGGSLTSVLFLIDLINSIEQKIITIGMGKCYSAGCLLLLGSQKGNRLIFRNCDLLLHEGATGYYGETSKFLDNAEHTKVIEKRLKDIILEKTNITKQQYNKNYRVEWYMVEDEIIKNGLADHIISNINEIL